MKPRNEKTSAPVTRDASALMNFKPGPDEVRGGIVGTWVPMTYVHRSRRVAASALSQTANKPRRQPPATTIDDLIVVIEEARKAGALNVTINDELIQVLRGGAKRRKS